MRVSLCCELLADGEHARQETNPVQAFGFGGGRELFSAANGSTVEGPEFTTTRFPGGARHDDAQHEYLCRGPLRAPRAHRGIAGSLRLLSGAAAFLAEDCCT